MTADERRRRLLADQLAGNRQTLAALRRHGVTDETELRVDFFFDVPGEVQARALAARLERDTEFEVRVTRRPAACCGSRRGPSRPRRSP
jgi:hypothetical protein